MEKETKRFLGQDTDFFLKEIRGLIHVGANLGQERRKYDKNRVDVLWIEPLTDIFAQLEKNLRDYPRQEALNYLVTDSDNREYEFFVSSNNSGASSSIMKPSKHNELWPNATFTNSLRLRGITLSSLIAKENIEINKYDALVMDTQGSELLVLKGAGDLLHKFRYIKTEVPDFDSYEGCCKVENINKYLEGYGFKEMVRDKFASKKGVGSYYDIVYKRLS